MEQLLPGIANLPSDEVKRRANELVRVIAERSAVRYDIIAQLSLGHHRTDIQDALGHSRRLDAVEVRRIVRAELVSTRPSRKRHIREELVKEFDELTLAQCESLAHGLHLQWPANVPILLSQTLAEQVVDGDLDVAVKALSELEAGKALARRLCLLRLLNDTEVDKVNQCLDADSVTCVGAEIIASYGALSGEAYVQSSRLFLNGWRVISLDGQALEISDGSGKDRLESLLCSKLNKPTSIPLPKALEMLNKRGERLVLLACPPDSTSDMSRLLGHLPPPVRVLQILPPEIMQVTQPRLPRLPPPDAAADEHYFSLSL
jgi:hypothetical protein